MNNILKEIYIMNKYLEESNIFMLSIIKDKLSRSLKKELNLLYSLESNNIPLFINLDILVNYVKQDIEPNIEYFKDINKNYTISNTKKAEWILSKAIKGSKLIGDGNTNTDIRYKDYNIDVSVLTLNKNKTNEKSIIQNFKQTSELDILFINKDGKRCVELFKNQLIKKYLLLTSIYYIFFICYNNSIYLTSFKLDKTNIKYLKFNSFSNSYKTIHIDNFIDREFGSLILYQSKKRLELRLYKNIINHPNTVKIY